ncbi:protein spaetzle 4 [Folsomia candida]|nr:protein spaetzle 4 [Folsomia candida]
MLTCPRPIKQKLRSGRWLRLQEEVKRGVPCDLDSKGSAGWCGVPGDKYPWSQVRRFVSENTGLMRRMYGEVRQLNLMRMEFSDSNGIEDYEVGDEGGRSLETSTVAKSVSMTTGGTTEEPATETVTNAAEEEVTMATEVYFNDIEKRNSAEVSMEIKEKVFMEEKPTLRAVNACPVREEVVAPYWANNTRGEILALLNLYPFEQYVHWEKCNQEHKQMYCREGCRCEQQYRLHRLLAFDPTNECRGIFSDWFRFPSCCVCKCYLTEFEISTHYSRAEEINSNSRSPRKHNFDFDYDFDEPDVRGVDPHFYYKENHLYPR